MSFRTPAAPAASLLALFAAAAASSAWAAEPLKTSALSLETGGPMPAEQQKLAVNSGVWPLYRYDPRRLEAGEPPLVLDAPAGKAGVTEYMRNETRFRMVEKIDPERFRRLSADAVAASARRVATYEHMARLTLPHRVAAVEPESNGNGHGQGQPVAPAPRVEAAAAASAS